MCFSATASFTAGAVLTTVGIICIQKKQGPEQLMLAVIPFIFAIQQFSEGFAWRAIETENEASLQFAMKIFLFFTLAFWPGWVPLSMLVLEKNQKRRQVLIFISTIGLVFSMAGLYYLFTRTPGIEIQNLHLRYNLHLPHHLVITMGFIYLIPTILPFFLSTVKKAVFIGWLVLLSHIVSLLFFDDAALSVWCFFAALISTLIYVILSEGEKEEAPLKTYGKPRRSHKRQFSHD